MKKIFFTKVLKKRSSIGRKKNFVAKNTPVHLYTCTTINIQSGGKSGHLVSSDIYEGNPFGKSVECKPSTEILEGVG